MSIWKAHCSVFTMSPFTNISTFWGSSLQNSNFHFVNDIVSNTKFKNKSITTSLTFYPRTSIVTNI